MTDLIRKMDDVALGEYRELRAQVEKQKDHIECHEKNRLILKNDALRRDMKTRDAEIAALRHEAQCDRGGDRKLKTRKEPMDYVLITTKHRGVFAGDLAAEDGTTVTLKNARCAIHFGTKGGFLELADTGPTDTSRIGSPAPEIKLFDVTSISRCSEAAKDAWTSR